jgi:hypothetical protein
MEQQFPFGQFPHTVFWLVVPQVPSVVTAAVAVAEGAMVEVAGPITGSAEVVVVPEGLLSGGSTLHPF